MPKTSRGGKRTTSVTSQAMAASVQIKPVQVVMPTPQQVTAGNVTPKGGVPFDQFEKMTDDQKAQVILDAMGCNTPSFLDDSYLQKLSYFTGLKSKPQVVDEATLNATPGYDLYRSVHSYYDKSEDINHSSKEIALQIMKGDFTMYSSSGGSAHGKAIYFDTVKGSYGSGTGFSILHAKIASGAVIKKESDVAMAINREIRSGSKLGQVLNKIGSGRDYQSQMGVYCLAKGIDGYKTSDTGYHMIINRRALIVSNKLS